jgi:hypothetical protein
MHTTSTYLALAALSLSLLGCAMTIKDTANLHPDYHATFTVQQNYGTTYGFILERQLACEEKDTTTASFVVEGNLFQDLQSAMITTTRHGRHSIKMLTVIDLHAAGDQATDVIISTDYPIDAYSASIQNWIAGRRRCKI